MRLVKKADGTKKLVININELRKISQNLPDNITVEISNADYSTISKFYQFGMAYLTEDGNKAYGTTKSSNLSDLKKIFGEDIKIVNGIVKLYLTNQENPPSGAIRLEKGNRDITGVLIS